MTKPVDFLFIDGFLFPSLLSCFPNFLQKVLLIQNMFEYALIFQHQLRKQKH